MAILEASRYRRGALAISVESTYGINPGTTVADIIEVQNVAYRVGQEQFRDERIAGTVYSRPDIPGLRTMEITGEILLKGTNTSSSGTTPEADRMLRAIGWTPAFSSGTWLYTAGDGSTASPMGESVSAELYHENAPKGSALGAMGTGTIRHRVGEPSVLAFRLIGKYVAPSTAALITQTPSTVIPPTFKGANLRVSTSSYAPRLATVEVDLGSIVDYVTDAGSTDFSGVAGAIIENRRPLITLDPEVVSTTAYDWHAKRDSPGNSGIGDPLEWTVGSTANATNCIRFTAPRFQVLDITPGQRSGTNIFNIAGKLNSATSAGPLTISFGV